MEQQLKIALAALVVLALIGCGKDPDDDKAFLNAPGVTERISADKANADRGISPELARQMAEPANHGGAKR